MTEPVTFLPEGPHSPEYTGQVAEALAEAVRVLSYATLGDAPGLDYPSDVYSLLGTLQVATSRLPQLMRQLSAFLDTQISTGRLADDHGADPVEEVASAHMWLGVASQGAATLTGVLERAQQAIAGLYVKEATDG